MRKRSFRGVWIIAVFIAFGVKAQIDIPVPTSTPEITRYHFAYNHVPPVRALENEDILISVYVEDVVTGDEMRIHFREGPGSGFHAMPMGYNPTDGRFEVSIEQRFHKNHSLQYYIEIFPVGLSPIRIPEASGEYYSVKVKKRFSKYIKPILIILLIASPAVGAYLFSKARKAHARRRAEYERRIRSRRRQLNREREKHYKEYLKTLSGGTRSQSEGVRPESRLPVKKSSKPKPPPDQSRTNGDSAHAGPAAKKPAKSRLPKSGSSLSSSTDEELRRELDNILNRTANAETVLIPDKKPPQKKKDTRSPGTKKKTGGKKTTRDSNELSGDDENKLQDLFND